MPTLHTEMRSKHEVMTLDVTGNLYIGGAVERLTDKVHSLLHQGYRNRAK